MERRRCGGKDGPKGLKGFAAGGGCLAARGRRALGRVVVQGLRAVSERESDGEIGKSETGGGQVYFAPHRTLDAGQHAAVGDWGRTV